MARSFVRARITSARRIFPSCRWRNVRKSAVLRSPSIFHSESPSSLMSHDIKSAERPAPDHILTAIADYALNVDIKSKLAYETAGYCLMDTLACGFQGLKYPACTRLMGPVVPGATLTNGARVPGTAYELDPINAAFNIGAMIRWLDFHDTWVAAEWGHPSDNLGGILAVAA